MPTQKASARQWRDKEIKKLRAKGLTLQAIGTAFGLTRERVRQILLGV